jgi:hypothetical protein
VARALFVDYENVERFDFAQVPPDVRVYWFFGANQTKVPTSLLAADPLIRHLRKLGHAVTKMKPVRARKTKAPPAPPSPPRYAEAVELLVKSPKNRPGSRAKLLKHLTSALPTLEDGAAETIVQALVDRGAVSVGATGKVTYRMEKG